MNNSKSNHVVACIRDGSCGIGGIHCPCCNNLAKNKTSFSRLVRSRLKVFVAKDFARNPY